MGDERGYTAARAATPHLYLAFPPPFPRSTSRLGGLPPRHKAKGEGRGGGREETGKEEKCPNQKCHYNLRRKFKKIASLSNIFAI